MHCISRGLRAVGEAARNIQGCGGPRLGRSHGRSQYLDAGCQNPVTAAGCPATGTGTGSLSCTHAMYPTGVRGHKNAGEKPGQPLNLGSTGLHIHQTRPNVPAAWPAWVPGRVVNICTRLQKVSWPCFSPSLFCFSRVPSVPFSLTSLSSSVPIPTIRWTRASSLFSDISQMF